MTTLTPAMTHRVEIALFFESASTRYRWLTESPSLARGRLQERNARVRRV